MIPEDLSDAALEAALVIAYVRRETDGRLGIRTEIADLEAEQARRAQARDEVVDLRNLWALS